MASFADRVKDVTTTTGATEAYLVASSASGYRSFGTAFSVGTSFYYCCENGVDFEVGLGTLGTGALGWTISRDSILASSNGGGAINWAAGNKNIFSVYPASVMLQLQNDIAVTLQRVGSITALRGMNPLTSNDVLLTQLGKQGHFYPVSGAAAGTYVDNGATVIVPTAGNGGAAFLRSFKGPVDPRWFDADPTGVTASHTAIAAAIASLRTVPYVDTDTGAITANATIHGGGQVLIDFNYKIGDTITLPPRVKLVGEGTLTADNTASWAATGLDILDRVEVSNGGTGYSNSFTVTFTGGGATTSATGKAYAVGGVIQRIVVQTGGEGYVSVPAIDLSAGGGINAVVTGYLKERAKPMVTCAADISVTYQPGVLGVTLNCAGVADGIEWDNAKQPIADGVTIFNPVYDGIRYLSSDMGGGRDIAIYSPGHYGVYGAANAANGCNEIEHHGLIVKYAGKANVKTEYRGEGCNAWRFFGGTISIADDGASEFILASRYTGHELHGVKIEHGSANTAPLILIPAGFSFWLDFIVTPRAPTVFNKFVHNAGGTDVNVALTCVSTVLDTRIDNPALASDISPFQSDVSQGLRVYRLPNATSTKLAKLTDWCRDQAGTSQTASNFLMLQMGRGLSQGLRTQRLDLESGAATDTVERTYVSGDTVARRAEKTSGEASFGSGAATADINDQIRNSLDTADATVSTLAIKALTAGQTITWEAWVSAKGTGVNAGYGIVVTAYHDGANAVIIGAVTALHTAEQNAAMACTFDVSAASVRLRVTGIAATAINWLSFSKQIIR